MGISSSSKIKKEEPKSILNKIKSKYILKDIFNYIYDLNF